MSRAEISGVRNRVIFFIFVMLISQFRVLREAGHGWVIARSSLAIYEWKSTHVSRARCRSDAPLQLFAIAHKRIDCAWCSREMIRYREKGARSCALAMSRAEGFAFAFREADCFVAPRRKTCSRFDVVSSFKILGVISNQMRALLRHWIPKLTTLRNF